MDYSTQGRLQDRKPVAVIDIGSNSIRLVVYEGLSRSPTPLFQEKAMCGLGRFLSSTRRLNEETIPFALASLSRFTKLAAICGVKERDLHPFATAAVRWAEDGEEFLATCGESLRRADQGRRQRRGGAARGHRRRGRLFAPFRRCWRSGRRQPGAGAPSQRCFRGNHFAAAWRLGPPGQDQRRESQGNPDHRGGFGAAHLVERGTRGAFLRGRRHLADACQTVYGANRPTL